MPTTLDEDNSDKCIGLSLNISHKRRKLTYDCGKKVHSRPSSTEPEVHCATANGLWSTLVKNCKTEVVTDVLKRSKTVCNTVVPQIVAKSVGTVFIGLQADIGHKPRPQSSYAKNQLD